MEIEDVVQEIVAATSTQEKLQGFQRLAETLQESQDLPFAVFTTKMFSEIVNAINPEKPSELCLAAILSLHHIGHVLVYTKTTAIWALGEDYLHSLLEGALLNSLTIHLNASDETVSCWAAKCLLVIAKLSSEMKSRVKLCGIPQLFSTLTVDVPESLALYGLTELICFLYDIPLPSLEPSDTFQGLLRKFYSAGIGMFYKLARLDFSPALNRENLSRLKPVVISILMDNNKSEERLWAFTLLKKYMENSDITSATREIVDAGIIAQLVKSFSHIGAELLVTTLECVSLIGQGGAPQRNAILESNIPDCLHQVLKPPYVLAEDACRAIHGLVKGGRLFAIHKLETKGLLEQVLQVLNTDERVQSACLTLLCVIQHGDETHKHQFVQEKCVTRSLCHLVKETHQLELYQVLKEMKVFLETVQNLGEMKLISEIVQGDQESQCKIDAMLSSPDEDMAGLCRDIKDLMRNPKK